VRPNVPAGHLAALVNSSLPLATANTISKVNSLYPSINGSKYSGSPEFMGYFAFNSSAQATAEAVSHDACRYIFDIPPGVQSTDLSYTFYAGAGIDPTVVSDQAAAKHQRFLTNYVLYGNPNGCKDSSGGFERYGKNATSLRMRLDGVDCETDPWKGSKCEVVRSVFANLE
jgi:hypothetical protein